MKGLAESGLDVAGLVAALEAQREKRDISWRELARQARVSPSTLSRMRRGRRPDVDTFSSLIRWLGMPAEEFMPGQAEPVPPSNQVWSDSRIILPSGVDLTPKGAEALRELVEAAFKLARQLK